MNVNEIRRRRKGKEPPNGRSAHKKSSVQSSSIQQSLICLITCCVILTLLLVLYTDHIPWHMGHRAVDSVGKVFGVYNPVHAVVIDAGSTGSRVLAYTFHKAIIDDHLVLDKELFVHTKPGLSAFADDPQKAVASISSLIEKAKAEIPQEYWTKTPIILKATAGLRLLNPEKAKALLAAVSNLFDELPFITDKDSVSIMDGTDEGIFSWFTVNYLLHNHIPSKTVAALDLGGGSTQVTFSANTPATLKQRQFIHDAILLKGTTQVYTNSYLGLGLMAARKEILTYKQPNATNVVSNCVNPIIKNRKFHYGGVDYIVTGASNKKSIVNITDCLKIVKEYVSSKASPPEELSDKKIFAFSYYFDRATETGLIDELQGGTITISEIIKTAKSVCSDANAEMPFMCLDLSFIATLLEQGFGLSGDTKINLYKKISGHEISWALGAAYNTLMGKK